MHKPVMLKEVCDILGSCNIVLDCTLGLGGHASALLELNKNLRLIGIDRDERALEIAKSRLSKFKDRVSIYHASFDALDEVLRLEGLSSLDGALFDLGVSMLQLKHGEGFSFQRDEFLDMRMDLRQSLNAWKVINTYPERELERIFRDYAQERLYRQLARAITLARAKKPINTTGELLEIIMPILKRPRGKTHPATRVFQAIRIEVNDEIGQLKRALSRAYMHSSLGARMVIISFHSLEDQVVKNFLKENMKALFKKPLTPSAKEIEENPSSRSAKLRAGIKVC
ncbi:MAG: 16S rRNA (cytosine(1402)-N(4))-methyltransferase RsmH [Aquificaceae bacterium]|nr:16S rRNA (cytosine(1402)-N(4))-methyltransferase RsmH [Aquificaceae bacterium]